VAAARRECAKRTRRIDYSAHLDSLHTDCQALDLKALTYEVRQGTIRLLRLTADFSPTINSGAWSFYWQTYSNSS